MKRFDLSPYCAEGTKVLTVKKLDALDKALEMAKQKSCPTRLSGFSGVKAYMLYVEVLKNHCNAVGRIFCDAIKLHF
jgi:hypothetical protein